MSNYSEAINREIKRASRNRGPKAFEDTHTIAGMGIRMVFCKIKLGHGCQITNPDLVDSAM